MADMHIERTYPRSVDVVWKALTDPTLVPLWTSTGQGGRPEGFSPVVGCTFRFVGRPFPGWDGIVRCEVTAVEAPNLLRYTWRNKPDDRPTLVTYLLEPTSAGDTRLTWNHTDFRGVEGFIMSKLLGRVRSKMLSEGLPAVLADLDENGQLMPTSTLRPRD
jgi:uncharacterized protein YndB with AHSA1/START domain